MKIVTVTGVFLIRLQKESGMRLGNESISTEACMHAILLFRNLGVQFAACLAMNANENE